MNQDLLERQVIGLAMDSKEILAKYLSRGIREKHFAIEDHKLIWAKLAKLFRENQDIGVASVAVELDPKILTKLLDIETETSKTLNPDYFGDILISAYWLRSAKTDIRTLLKELDRQTDLEEIEKLRGRVLDVLGMCTNQSTGLRIADSKSIIESSINSVMDAAERSFGTGILGISTGFKKLDATFGGFQEKQYYVVGARPAVGKTTLALNFVSEALRQNKHVFYVSYEMGKESLGKKLFSIRTKINGNAIQTGDLNQGQLDLLQKTVKDLKNQHLYIEDSGKSPIEDIAAEAKVRKMRGQLDLLVVDYLQLAKTVKTFPDKQREVSHISGICKAMSMDLNVPVIGLAQVKRGTQDNKPLKLDDLKESGAIEQDADVIMFLQRPKMAQDPFDREGYITIGKNRFGKTGTVNAYCCMELSSITGVDS